MDVHLTRQQAELLRRLVAEGGYSSADEAILEGMKLLERELAWKADARKKIQEGLDDVAAGRVVDGEKAVEEIRRKLKRKHGKKRA